MPIAQHRMQRQQGFTLIEVLVAVLILSFGMLGLIGMQAFAMQSNREARIHSQATSYARELAEMMRGNNQVAIKTTTADNPYLFAASSNLAITSPPDCLKSVAGTGCTSSTDTAQAQMADWLDRVATALPGAMVAVCFDTEPYNSNGIPQWICTNTGETLLIKMNWTTRSTDSSASDDDALIKAANSSPQIVIPVTGGNPLGM